MTDSAEARPADDLHAVERRPEAEQLESPETEPTTVGASAVFSRLSAEKRAADAAIASQARLVGRILDLSESTPASPPEVQTAESQAAIGRYEEIMRGLEQQVASVDRTASHEQIVEILMRSNLLAAEGGAWLDACGVSLNNLSTEGDASASRGRALAARLATEAERNFLMRFLRKGKRLEAEAQLREEQRQSEKLSESASVLRAEARQIKSALREIAGQSRELARRATRELFHDIAASYQQLCQSLAADDAARELNQGLIAKYVTPRLEKLRADGLFTQQDVEEYIKIVKTQLSKGNNYMWDSTEEQARLARLKRLDELNRAAGSDLGWSINRDIGSDAGRPADEQYGLIFSLLLTEMAKDKVEETRDAAMSQAGAETQKATIAGAAENVINTADGLYPHGRRSREGLDVRRLPIERLTELTGLRRWGVIRELAVSSGLIPSEIFARVEKIITQRLFEEKLFPGGFESGPGTDAAHVIECFGNPEALPLFLRHIEAHGSGHTSNAVVYVMERLLGESPPEAVSEVLASLPRNKRLLLRALVDENSFLCRFGRGYGRYDICRLLQNGGATVVKEQLTKILQENCGFGEERLRNFFWDQDSDPLGTVEALLQAREQVEEVIIDGKLSIWSLFANKLLGVLVDPERGDWTAFPRRVAREGIGVPADEGGWMRKLDEVFTAKRFQESFFERKALLDGLILLNSKEDGLPVLKTLLGAYRSPRHDPKRLRRIFQLLGTLDGMGEYGFGGANEEEIERLQREISELDARLRGVAEQRSSVEQKSGASGKTDSERVKERTDKAQNKALKDQKETLGKQLQDLTGLKGIEEAMTQRVVETACRKLDLPAEYRQKIATNLDELLKSGILEIAPVLAGHYAAKGELEVQALLKTIIAHIVEGDWRVWRYGHKCSAAQLAGLSAKQRVFWQTDLEPVVISVELSADDASRRADELKAAQAIVGNAREHILQARPDLDFSRARVGELNTRIDELIARIKTATSPDAKKIMAREKGALQAEAALISGILEIEGATPQSYSRGKITSQAGVLSVLLRELNIPAAGLDIEQMGRIFTIGDVLGVSAYETDDPLSLLKVGVEPQETCQSWRQGSFNECLLAYVADANKRVLNVADSTGRVVARSVIKLTEQREVGDVEGATKRTTLLVERPYSLLPNPAVFRAFIRVLLAKARGLNAAVTFAVLDKERAALFTEEAAKVGYGRRDGALEIFIPPSMNKYEYSDALGGKINYFNTRKSLMATTFEPTSAA